MLIYFQEGLRCNFHNITSQYIFQSYINAHAKIVLKNSRFQLLFYSIHSDWKFIVVFVISNYL